jgi:hypothetical protein
MKTREDYLKEHQEYEDRKQKEFYDKYPKLFPKRELNDWDKRKGYIEPTQEPLCGFSCDVGWFPLLDKLFSKLTQLIEESNLSEEYKLIPIDQCKQKFGGLRVYFGSVHEELYDKAQALVDEAEQQSFNTCERCGEPGKIRPGGWIEVRCDACQKDHEEYRKKECEKYESKE